jgi:hypothetical protein
MRRKYWKYLRSTIASFHSLLKLFGFELNRSCILANELLLEANPGNKEAGSAVSGTAGF